MNQELLQGLTPDQCKAVVHKDGPCLVIAGAGTGKTTVITRRIAYLIGEQEIAPENILALTFTDKAAREMEERVDQLLPYGVTGTTISTFHSFCAEVLRRHAFMLGIDPASKLLATADEVSFLRQHLSSLPTQIYKPSKNPIEFLRSLVQFCNKAKDECLTPEQMLTFAEEALQKTTTEAEREQAAKVVELSRLYQVSQQLYKDHSVLSYGDLIFYARQLLQDFPSVQAEEHARYRYVLVDEFQDTNFGQSEVARLLVAPSNNIMAVGDDDQAIYSFRGANLANILNFTKDYPGASIITLTENFRSSQAILDAAYTLIQHNNPDRLEVQEKVNKKLTSNRPGEIKPEHWHFERGIFEQNKIAEQIKEFISSGEYQPEDIAILVRSRAHSKGIEAALEAQGIPYQYAGDSKFFNLPIVQQAISFLRFLVNPHQDLNTFFLLSHPPFSLSAYNLQKYVAAAHYTNVSLYEYLQEDPELAASVSLLTELLEEESASLPSQFLLQYLHKSGLYEQLQREGNTLEQLATLHEELLSFESSRRNTSVAEYIYHLDALLDTEEDVSLQQPRDTYKEGVQIMTVHKSKGLEFPVVFVSNLVKDRFPSRNFGDTLPFPYELTRITNSTRDSNLQEERRLAYVAMTRAKDRLILTSSELYDDRKSKAKLSPFIQEALQIEAPPEPLSLALKQTLVQPVAKQKLASSHSFSPSALETFERCPKQFEYQYVLRLKVAPTFSSNFGISLHETLKEWFESLKRGEQPELAQIYKGCWQRGGYENRTMEEEYYANGLIKLQEYLDNLIEGAEPVEFEVNYRLELKDGSELYGRIDRIDTLAEGGYSIVDYKTGESSKRAGETLSGVAMGSYILGMEAQGKEIKQAELHYIMIGEKVVVRREDISSEDIQQQALETIGRIKEGQSRGEYPAKPNKINCSYCEYRSICPFRYGKL